MGYNVSIYPFRDSTEYEYGYTGEYGAKGERRAPRAKPTAEQMEKQNQYNRENRVRRLIKANFRPNDLWMTLKYPAGTRKTPGEVRKDVSAFLSAMRRAYKKRGEAFLFIIRMEVGRNGGIHIHILLNRPDSMPDTDRLVQAKWKYGRVNYESIYETGGYRKLAAYIVKKPAEEIEGQLALFPEGERKAFCSYSSSRNLVRPQPERRSYSRRTMRKLVEQVRTQGRPEPSPGYYIDMESVRCGVNPYTGMSYLHYTECRIRTERQEKEGG